MEQNEFMACGTCAAKPGTPDLCQSCLVNRGLIGEWQSEAKELRKRLEILKSILRGVETLA